MLPESFAEPLAENVRSLREAQGLTQAALSKRAKVPRATLSLLESGSANPTLSVVIAVCNALGVRLEEMLEPVKSETLVFRQGDLSRKSRRGVTITRILPRSIAGVEIEELEIPGGKTLTGIPHRIGTREYLRVQVGCVQLSVAGEYFHLGAGDVAVFQGHQKHSYRNETRSTARAYSVIALDLGSSFDRR